MAALNYTQRKKLGRGIFHVVVIFLCFLMTYPLLYMVFSSFKTAQDIFQRPNALFPQEFTLLCGSGADCLLGHGGLRLCEM